MSSKRFRVVRNRLQLAILDRDTGLLEPISSDLLGLLDMSKVEPLRHKQPAYVDLLSLEESVRRAREESKRRRMRI